MGSGNGDLPARVSAGGARGRFLCDRHKHDLCFHLPEALSADLAYRNGTGPSLADMELCPCSCHLGCPLTAADAWPDTCTCNGTLQFVRLRDGRAQPIVAEPTKAQKEQRATLKVATRAVKVELSRHGVDRSRETVATFIQNTWAAHGLSSPDEPLLGLMVDKALDPNRLRAFVVGIRGWTALALLPVRFWQSRTSLERVRANERARQWDIFTIAPGEGIVPVVLDRGGRHALDALSDWLGPFGSVTAAMGVSRVLVELRTTLGPAGRGLAVHVPGGGRLGSLVETDSEPFRAFVVSADRVGQAAVAAGVRLKLAHAQRRLYVQVPLTKGSGGLKEL